MTGNAFQWCQDGYRDCDKGAATDPTGAATGGPRVLRGGSWSSFPRLCRVAYRCWINPVTRSGYLGFRVAVVAAGVD